MQLGAFTPESKEIILCEALIDALTFWEAGFRNVISSYGIQGFTAAHLEALRRHGTERVLIAYDRDEAGERAAEALARKLQREGLGCFRVQFPRGQDANEYARNVPPAAKSLALVLRSAVWLGKGPAPTLTSVPREPEEPSLEVLAALAASTAARATKEEKPPRPESEPGPIEPQASLSPLVAAPLSATEPPPTLQSEARAEQVLITLEDRLYRVRGLEKNLSPGCMRVNVLLRWREELHADTLDLHLAKPRQNFAKTAAPLLGLDEALILRDLGRVLLKLEELQDQAVREALAPKPSAPALSEAETAEAFALLRDPRLLSRIAEDLEACGLVGETTNKLTAYLAATSRKLDAPLAIIVQSSSAAGKSALMDAILSFMPPEERVKYSAMTGQSLFYMDGAELKHKILAIAEEEGASRASYALKLLQSDGELTIACTGKHPETGRQVTHQYRVEGPVMIFLTTTSIEIDEELLNRCLVLTVDEGREQTRAILRIQRERETLEGLLAKTRRASLLKLHQNAQRLLKPLSIVNPYARELTFPDEKARLRRDHAKYLALIRSITLLHQFQRPSRSVKVGGVELAYVETTPQDIETANRLASEVLGRSLDELPPQPRRLLLLIEGWVAEQCERLRMKRTDFRFSRRDVRQFTGWGNTQLKAHLGRLEDLEYLLVHRGSRGQSFVYELLYDGKGQEGERFLPGLIDVEALRTRAPRDENKSGENAEKSGPSRGQAGPLSGGGRMAAKAGGADSGHCFEGLDLENLHINEPISPAPPAPRGLITRRNGSALAVGG